MVAKVNVDNFSIGPSWRRHKWSLNRRHPVAFLINRSQWYYYPKQGKVPDFPLHVDFEAAAACDLSCPMCFRVRDDYSKTDMKVMPLDLFKKGIDECVKYNLYSIRLSWRGEVTINPNLVEMVRYAKEKGIKEVSFFSHGLRIDGELAEGLVDAGLDYLTFSVDDLHEEYDKIRAPITFEIITERIRNMRRLRDEKGNGYPKIRINSVWHDGKGKDFFQKLYDYFGSTVDYMTYTPEYAHDGTTVKLRPNFTCQYPFQRVSIFWNGVVPLCITDKHPKYVIGDLNNESIHEIWHGERMEYARKLHLEHQADQLAPCKVCYRAVTRQSGNVNVA